METNKIYCGDCLEIMKTFPDESIDAVISDPPYFIGLLGKEWDTNKNYYEFLFKVSKECFRILKPGGSIMLMGYPRTYHRLGCAVEDAGFFIKDCIIWGYNTGFPKARDLTLLIDSKVLGISITEVIAQRLKIGKKKAGIGSGKNHGIQALGTNNNVLLSPKYVNITIPLTEEGAEWIGWKVGGLKPAYEPIVWGVKPPKKTMTENVLEYKLGAVNIGDCRIPYEIQETLFGKDASKDKKRNTMELDRFKNTFERESEKVRQGADGYHSSYNYIPRILETEKGRYPSNMMWTDVLTGFEEYSKFYYIPKPTRKEKDKGCEHLPEKEIEGVDGKDYMGVTTGWENRWSYSDECQYVTERRKTAKNNHPTVKPIALMAQLIKLVTIKKQIVLDPFCGSGSTLIACKLLDRNYVGIELNEDYKLLAEERVKNFKP